MFATQNFEEHSPYGHIYSRMHRFLLLDQQFTGGEWGTGE